MSNKTKAINQETEMICENLFKEAIKPAFDLCDNYELFLEDDNSEWNIKSKCNCLTLCLAVAFRELLQNFSNDVDTDKILHNFLDVNLEFVLKVKNQKLSKADHRSLKIELLENLERYIDLLRASNYDHMWNITVLKFLPPFGGKYYYNYFEDAAKVIINQEKLLLRMFLYKYLEFRRSLKYVQINLS
jgi:hypothetical protein